MDLFEGNEFASLAVSTFEDLWRAVVKRELSNKRVAAEREHTVAYVPSPSFSSCWKELGCLLASMIAVEVLLVEVVSGIVAVVVE